jgi:hypothetical protein
LLLAYSGFFNIYNNENSYQESNFFDTSEGETPISNFFDKMKLFLKHANDKKKQVNSNKLGEQDGIKNDLVGKFNLIYDENGRIRKKEDHDTERKIYYEHEILSHYSEKLLKIEMNEQHHQTSFKIAEGDIKGIITNPKNDKNYSLFFYRNNSIYEWREFSGELIQIKKNIKKDYMRENIYNYVIKNRKESEIFYEDDITIFSEITDEPIEKFDNSDKYSFKIILYYILFFIFYFMIFPPNEHFKLTLKIIQDFDLTHISKKENFVLKDKNDLLYNFPTRIFDKIYSKGDQNKNRINFLTNDTREKMETESKIDDPNKEKYVSLLNNNNTFYLNNNILYCGMLIYFKVVKTDNKTSISNALYENIPMANLMLEEVVQIYENKNIGKLKIKDSIYGLNYQFFLPGELTNETTYKLRENLVEILEKKIGHFIYIPIFYSFSTETIFCTTYDLKLDSFNNIISNVNTISRRISIFSKEWTYEKILIIIILIINILGMIDLSIQHMNVFFNSVIEAWKLKKKFITIIKWRYLVELVVEILTIFCCIYAIYIYFLINESNILAFSKDQELEFVNFYQRLINEDIFKTICAFNFFLLNFRIFRLLFIKFPSYGILLKTIELAQEEIFAYFFLVFIMLLGVSGLAYTSFGSQLSDYTNFYESIYGIYLMFLGIFMIEGIKLKDMTNDLISLIASLILLFFHLIIINVFISIFLNNYKIAKEKYSKFNLVYSIISEEKFEELIENILNLLSLKHPQLIEFENQNKKKQTSRFLIEKKNEENLGNEQQIEQDKIPKISSVSIFDIFVYNFKRIKIFKLLDIDIDKYDSKKKDYLQKAEEKNLNQTLNTFKMDYDSEFKSLFATIFFVFYIYIFFETINRQFRINTSKQIIEHADNKFLYRFKSVYNNTTSANNDIINFLEVFYDINNDNKIYNINNTYNSNNILYKNGSLNIIETNNTNENEIKCNDTFKQKFLSKFIFFNPTKFRLTFNLFTTLINESNITRKYFPIKKKSSLSYYHDPDNYCKIDNYKKEIKIGNIILKYSKLGQYNSANNCGGYVINLSNEGFNCVDKPVKNIISKMLEMNNFSELSIEFFLFSLYERLAIHIQITVFVTETGEIKAGRNYNIIPINLFSHREDLYRVLVELIFLFISIIYIYKTLKEILCYLKQYIEDDFNKDPDSDKFKKSFVINKFFRVSYHNPKYKNNFIYLIGDFIYIFLKKIFLLISWSIKALLYFLKIDGYNIMDFLYIIFLSISIYIYLFNILPNTLDLDLDIYSKNSYVSLINQHVIGLDPPDNYTNLQILMEYYNTMCLLNSICGSLILIRIFSVFRFSQSINTIMLVFYKAKNIVLFHIFSIILYNFAFCIMGFGLFSHQMENFSTLKNCIISLLKILGEEIEDLKFPPKLKIYGILYIYWITFSNYLILGNVLLCIVLFTYYEVKNEIKMNFGENFSEYFILKIGLIIKNKIILIFERIHLYYYDVIYYFELTQGYQEQLNSNFKMSNLLKYLEFLTFKNHKSELEELSKKAEKCEIGKKKKKNSKKKNILLIDNIIGSQDISIFEKIFCFIFFLLQKEPNMEDIIEIENDIDNSSPFNDFYEKRFINDNKKKHKKNILKNEYLKKLLIVFKKDFIKRSNSYFKKPFYKKFKNYIYEKEIIENKNVIIQNNISLFYSKKSIQSLNNLTTKINLEEIFKIQAFNFKKLLNIIIFKDETNLDKNKYLETIDFKNLINLVSFDNIKHNNNFNDIINTKCIQLEYLKIISMVYDLIVKYYYVPNELSRFEEKICLSFWMKKYQDIEFNTQEYNYLKWHLPELKDSLFLKDIKKLISFDFKIEEKFLKNKDCIKEYIINKNYNISNDYFDDLKNHKNNKEIIGKFRYIIIKNNDYDNYLDDGFLKRGSSIRERKNYNTIDDLKEKCLKLYLIWNTIFIIFFRKNFIFVRFLENISFSRNLLNDYKNKGKDLYKNNICYKSPYIYLFSNLFFLDKKYNETRNLEENLEEGFIVKKRIDEYLHQFNQFINFNSLDNNEIPSAHSLFFKDISKYILNSNDLDFEKNLFKNNSEYLNKYHISNRFENFYPNIFINLWSDFDIQIKKTLYFGFNILFQESVSDIEIFSKKEYYSKIINDLPSLYNDYKCFKIDRFMTAEHRSHFFYFLNFPDDDFIEIKRLVILKLEKQVSNDELIKKRNFEEILKFIQESQLRIITVYEIYNIIFDKLFSNLKEIMTKLIDKHNDLFDELVMDNVKFFDSQKARLKFVKFFKYILNQKKFNLITGMIILILLFNFLEYFTQIAFIQKKIIDGDDQIINHLKKYELLIFFLSLHPHELIVTKLI